MVIPKGKRIFKSGGGAKVSQGQGYMIHLRRDCQTLRSSRIKRVTVLVLEHDTDEMHHRLCDFCRQRAIKESRFVVR